MIAVDTNVLVRVLTRDDPAQARRAARILQSERVFIPKTVMLETEWVLRYAYRIETKAIMDGFKSRQTIHRSKCSPSSTAVA